MHMNNAVGKASQINVPQVYITQPKMKTSFDADADADAASLYARSVCFAEQREKIIGNPSQIGAPPSKS